MADLETRETDRHTGRTDTAKNRTNSARSCNFSNWHFSAMIAVEHAAIKANRIMLLANAATAARNQQKLTNNYGCPGGGIWIWTGSVPSPWVALGGWAIGRWPVMCSVMSTPRQAESGGPGWDNGLRTELPAKSYWAKERARKDLCMRKNFTSH